MLRRWAGRVMGISGDSMTVAFTHDGPPARSARTFLILAR